MFNKCNMFGFCFLVWGTAFFVSANVSQGNDAPHISVSNKLRFETFGGNNVSLLNDNNPFDKFYYSRDTFDCKVHAGYGDVAYGEDIFRFNTNIRARGVWGNDDILFTSKNPLKLFDVVDFNHGHALQRLMLWIRELSLDFDIGRVLNFDCCKGHRGELGIFPFSLGRGITLGNAYALSPEGLGFYSNTIVDQYAPGGRVYGPLYTNCLSYDGYVAILENKCSSLSDTALKIRGQEFGMRDHPERGFGVVNFVCALRFPWVVFDNRVQGRLYVEPYLMYNDAPEQQIEFLADASSKLATFGLAVEYKNPCFEFGFDYAFNTGRQKVKGWDRNTVTIQNREGNLVFVNTHVLTNADPVSVGNNNRFAAVHAPSLQDDSSVALGKQAQSLINTAFQGEEFNGKAIGSVDGFTDAVNAPVADSTLTDTFFNSTNRFRDPYTNTFEGWMFVADAGYWVHRRTLELTATVGIATGDDNPNEITKDGNYTGWIGLQEVYSGKRVPSAFFLDIGKLKRPLSQPLSEQAPNRFAAGVSHFTDVVFWGVGAHFFPSCHDAHINANMLFYWQDKPTRKFDALAKKELKELASTSLGCEVNIFADWTMFDQFKLFLIGSLFIPGDHYRDIKGKPLTSDQEKALDKLDTTGYVEPRIPNIGDDLSFTLNIGCEYLF